MTRPRTMTSDPYEAYPQSQVLPIWGAEEQRWIPPPTKKE